jgi:hypothetical protein
MVTDRPWPQDFTSTFEVGRCLYRDCRNAASLDPEGQVNTHPGRLTTRRLHRFALPFRQDRGGFFGDAVITVGYPRSV